MTPELLRELLSPEPTTYRRFLDEWFGPRRPDYGVPGEELASPIPSPLRGFYEYAGRWPGLFGFNHLCPPDELTPDENGRIEFCWENQGVCAWATRADDDDPLVYYRGALESDPAERFWHMEGVPLSRFLLQLVLFEAAIGAPFTGSGVTQPRPALDRILQGLSPVPLAPWLWHNQRFWVGDDAVAVVSRDLDSDPEEEVWLGARRREPVEHLRDLPPEIWAWLILTDD